MNNPLKRFSAFKAPLLTLIVLSMSLNISCQKNENKQEYSRFKNWKILKASSFFGNKKLMLNSIESGDDVNAKFKGGEFAGYTPIKIASREEYFNDKEIIKLLMEHGADPGL